MRSHSLLAVFSHPDDETIVSPLLAKYAHEGHSVHLLVLTAGEKGYRAHAGIPTGPALAAVRAQELACAAATLGLTGFTLLQFPDQGFSAGYDTHIWKDAVNQVREAINRLRPEVLLTWGPEGGTGHPDHRATHSVVVQAFQHRALLQHAPRKLYYALFPETAVCGAEDWATGTRVSREFITTDVDCTSYLPAANAAVECHRSQFTPELMGKVRSLCEAEHGHVFLRLAYSTAAPVPLPETGIFGGLSDISAGEP
jgi:LmbE family N-acetylglucosaminyl deacetylase